MLVRAGHTEACCDLARLAGLTPAAVLCEIMRDDGSMARLPDLLRVRRRAQAEDRHHRRSDRIPQPQRVAGAARRRSARSRRPGAASAWCRTATCRSVPSTSRWCSARRIPKKETLVRVHEPLSIIDLLDAGKSTHSWGVGDALQAIQQAGSGVMVLMNCGQPGEALEARLAEDRPPKAGRSVDLRLYGIGAQILRDLGVGRMRLMAAPRKMPSMAGFGLEVMGYLSGPAAEPGARRSAERHAPGHRRQPLQRGDLRRAARAGARARPASWESRSRKIRSRGARDPARAAVDGAVGPLRRAGRGRRGDPRRHLPLRGGVPTSRRAA